MENFSGVERLALPFLAGTLLPNCLPPQNPLLLCAAISAAVPLCLLLPRENLKFTICWFLLGILHCCSIRLSGAPALPHPDGMSALAGRIRSIRFPNEQTSALLCALLTGAKELLSAETIAAFRRSGASHVLALSGLHLGIIYLLLEKLTAVLGRSRPAWILRSVILCGACIWYALATGGSPSVVRATLFVLIRETGRHCPGRRLNGSSVYCTALMLQTVANPEVVSSPGFQLSYLAVLGIILLHPRLDAMYDAFGRTRGLLRKIWSMMSLSISCQLFTAPLCWKIFGSVPMHFLLTNLIAIPLTELLIPSSLFLLLSDAMLSVKTTEAVAVFVDKTAGLLTYSLQTIAALNS